MPKGDQYNLDRFIAAQEAAYQDVVLELKAGQKRTHWMWFIFPQIDGLGHSTKAKYFAIKSIEEARAYWDHPILGSRLLECATLVDNIKSRTASEIFGSPDDLKFRSSLTLFTQALGTLNLFEDLLRKHFAGDLDDMTLAILKSLKKE